MNDPVEWAMTAFCIAGAILLLSFGVMLGGTAYFAVACYQSGDPDSMACYVTNGKTERVKADVSVK